MGKYNDVEWQNAAIGKDKPSPAGIADFSSQEAAQPQINKDFHGLFVSFFEYFIKN